MMVKQAAVVSQALAARQWRGRSPIGEQVRVLGDDAQPWRTIVGVVSDVLYGNMLSPDRSAEAIYVPLLQTEAASTRVFVRHGASEVAARQALHRVFGAIDPDMVPGYAVRASEVIEKGTMLTVGLVKLFGACFAFALVLAMVGSYGLMSASIGQRTGVANVFGINFSGFVAWWLWRTIYLSKLPRAEKKLRVALDWTLDLLFSKDLVQFATFPSNAARSRRARTPAPPMETVR